MSEPIEKLRREKDEYRKAYDDLHMQVVQLRARERQLMSDIEMLKQGFEDKFMALDFRYKKAFQETMQTIHEHPGGKCKDCDMKALMEKIREIAPKIVARAKT